MCFVSTVQALSPFLVIRRSGRHVQRIVVTTPDHTVNYLPGPTDRQRRRTGLSAADTTAAGDLLIPLQEDEQDSLPNCAGSASAVLHIA